LTAGVAEAKPRYRLVATILDHGPAPAVELEALYHERWEIESMLDELLQERVVSGLQPSRRQTQDAQLSAPSQKPQAVAASRPRNHRSNL
jgi:hypothetical protein